MSSLTFADKFLPFFFPLSSFGLLHLGWGGVETVLLFSGGGMGGGYLSFRRQNGERVVSVLEGAGGALAPVEKASIDEVYVDVTRAAQALLCSVRKNNNDNKSDNNDNDNIGSRSRSSSSSSDSGKERVVAEDCGAGSAENATLPVVGSGGGSASSGERSAKKEEEKEEDKEEEEERCDDKRELDEGMETSAVNGGDGKRWEEIGEGGWAAVVLEATGTHVSVEFF